MNALGLDRALKALRPYLGDLVLCGAWAWYLYRRCLAPDRWVPAEFTRDLDCIGKERLPVRGDPLLNRLANSAFVWVPRGPETPPVAHFAWPDPKRADVEIEFLAPSRGDGTREIVELQPGLTAQALRHLEILTDSPLVLAIDDRSPLPEELEFRGSVRLPKIGHFVIQKALIHKDRRREKQVKDIFYVFDLIDRENGLNNILSQDVVAAEAKWKTEVGLLVDVLEQRIGEPAFLKGISEQYPEEKRPSPTYVEREVQDWLKQFRGDAQRDAGPA